MAVRSRSRLWRYPASLLAVAAVAATCVALRPRLGATAPALLLAAVIGGTWAGGLGPGLVAAVVAALALDYFFIEPAFAPVLTSDALVSVTVFLGSAAFVSSLVEARRRAEAAEHRRRVRYEAMLIGVGEGVLAVDAGGCVTFLNAAAEALTGWPRAEAIGRALGEVLGVGEGPPGDRIEGFAARALRQGVAVESRSSAILVDRTGRRRPIEGRAAPIRGPEGGFEGVVAVFRDVAERRRAEGAAAELATIVASSPDAIIGRGPDGRITSWNAGAERLFGYEAAGAIGRPMTMLLPPDTADEMPRMLARIEGGLPISHYETERITRDGRRIDVSVSVSPLRDGDGQVVGLSTITRDVTGRRRAERRLAAQYAVSRILSEGPTAAEAAPRLLEALCLPLQYDVGLFWKVDGGVLRCDAAWHRGGPAFDRFEKACRSMAVAPGEGTAGGAWMAGEARWSADVAEGGHHARAAVAMSGGLRAAVAFPIRVDDETAGVVELLGGDPAPPEDALLGMLGAVGGQVGQFVERRRAEAELKVAEARFRRLADSGVLGILVADTETPLIYDANDALLAMIGASRDDLDAGRLDWVAMTPTEYREADARALAQLRTARSVEPFAKEYVGLHGRRVPILVGITMLDDVSTRCLAFIVDISERRRAEEALLHRGEQLRLALDVARMGTWEWDVVTGRVDWSGQIEAIHGLAPGGFGGTLGHAMELVHPDDLPAVREALERSTAVGADFDVEFRVVTTDGQTRWIGERGRVLHDAAGRPARILGVGVDISASKRAEQDLRRAKERADAANLAKDQFLAVLSHELRTPLNPVLAAVSAMVDDRSTPDEFRPILRMVRRNVELEARLIDDLLDITRIATGKLRLETEAVDAHELLSQALEICMADLREKGIRYRVGLEAGSHHVAADPARLQQVFWNLLKNAVKFTPGGGLVAISSREEAGRLVVEVADTGLGIEAEALPRIFDAFEQGEASITRRFGGLGLGLAISRSVVELLGGRLSARSDGRDLGSTFRIDLPLVPEPAAPSKSPGADGPPRADDESTAAAEPVGPLRVLLVDDSEDSLAVLARLLRARGHDVVTADSVASALDRADADGFDLLISDIGLPDGTGLDVIRGVRERARADLPAIALSGYGMESDRRQTREAGFSAHLTKPVDIQQVEAAIRSVVAEAAAPRGGRPR